MKRFIRFPDGTKEEILDENSRFYITKDAQFRKSRCANCTIEEEKQEEEKKPVKKAAKKPKDKE